MNATVPATIPSTSISEAIEKTLIQGDLSKLTSDQRVEYYRAVCQSVGLNPLTNPFEFITLNKKLTLYAKKDATDQIRKIHGVSIVISSREMIGDVYVVTARARMPDGREDESTGAVSAASARGEMLANLYMKAETKAKRRATLSICGLGLLDETEVESIPGAVKEETSVGQEKKSLPTTSTPTPDDELAKFKCYEMPSWLINDAKAFVGKVLADCPSKHIQAYQLYVQDQLFKLKIGEHDYFIKLAAKSNVTLSRDEVSAFICMLDEWVKVNL